MWFNLASKLHNSYSNIAIPRIFEIGQTMQKKEKDIKKILKRYWWVLLHVSFLNKKF